VYNTSKNLENKNLNSLNPIIWLQTQEETFLSQQFPHGQYRAANIRTLEDPFWEVHFIFPDKSWAELAAFREEKSTKEYAEKVHSINTKIWGSGNSCC